MFTLVFVFWANGIAHEFEIGNNLNSADCESAAMELELELDRELGDGFELYCEIR
jgi:hypothetical protein